MSQTLLQLVQQMCLRQGLAQPSSVTASNDPQILQLWGMANEILDDLITRLNWTALQQTAPFTGTGVYLQGPINTIAPNGFQWMIKDTFWCPTTRLPIFGPMSPQEWEEALAVPFTGPWYRYRLQQNNLLIYPAPPITNSYVFEYASSWPVNLLGTGVNFSQYYINDTDTTLLDDRLVALGLRWKWRAEKGLPYLEQFRSYEAAVNDLAGNDGTKKTVSMADGGANFKPGILIPAGNWKLP